MVGLAELERAFGLKAVQQNGEVRVNDKVVASELKNGATLVNLQEFSSAAGLTYRPQGARIEVNVTEPPFRRGVTDKNFQTPGALLDLASLPVRGKYTLLFCYRDGGLTAEGTPDGGYLRLFTDVEKFAQYPDVAIVKVNVGPAGSPLMNKYKFSGIPALYLFDKRAGFLAKAFGHGIFSVTKDPDASIKDIRATLPSGRPPEF